MPYRRGAPLGNRNRLKHGHYARTTLSLRRACRRTLDESKVMLAEARTLDRLIASLEGIAAFEAAGGDPATLAALAESFERGLSAFESRQPSPYTQDDPYTDEYAAVTPAPAPPAPPSPSAPGSTARTP